MTPFKDFNDAPHPFRIQPEGEPVTLKNGHQLHSFQIYHNQEVMDILKMASHASLSLIRPGFTLEDGAWQATGSLEGLHHFIDRLRHKKIPCFYYRVSWELTDVARALIQDELIPQLLADGFRVFAWEETGSGNLNRYITICAASPEPFRDFYTPEVLSTLFEWRAELWDVPFNPQILINWDKIFNHWSVSEVAKCLLRPVKFGKLKRIYPGSVNLLQSTSDSEWFLNLKQENRELKRHHFDSHHDLALLAQLLKGFPIELAMGYLYDLSR